MNKVLVLFYPDTLTQDQILDIVKVLSACFDVKLVPVSIEKESFSDLVQFIVAQVEEHLGGATGDYFKGEKLPHLCAVGEATLVVSCLLKREELKVDRVALSGALLSRRFPWARLCSFGARRLTQVWNEFAPNISVRAVPILSSLINKTLIGDAGRKGFIDRALVHDIISPDASCDRCPSEEVLVHNVPLAGFAEATSYLRFGHIRDVWLPFLLGFDPADYARFWPLCLKAKNYWDSFKAGVGQDEAFRHAWNKILLELGKQQFRWLCHGRDQLNLQEAAEAALEERTLRAGGDSLKPDELASRAGLAIWYTAQAVAAAFERLETHDSSVSPMDLRALHLHDAFSNAVATAFHAQIT